MNLLKLTWQYIGWQRSLLRKVGRLTPGYLILTVSLFTISQVSTFLAFFLPFKVILMVATEGVPRYLRLLVTQENRDAAIVFFAVGAVVFYLIQLMTEHLASRYSHRAGASLLERSKKLSLFGNEVQLARDVFLKLSRTMGGLLMTIGGFILGFYLNVLLFGVLVLAIFLEYLGFCYVWQRVDKPERLQDRITLTRKTTQVLKLFSSLNFFLGFGLLLYVFLSQPEFGLIRGILSFILMRQVMQRLQGAIQDALFLHQNKTRINALFYTNIHYQPQISAHETGFLELLRPDNRKKWLTPLIKAHGLETSGAWKWLDVQGKNTALLWDQDSEDKDAAVYVRMYCPNQQLIYTHETMLFQTLGKASQLVPDPLADLDYQGFNVIIFKGPSPQAIDRKKTRQIVNQAMTDMWSIALEPGFVSQCCRTKPVLSGRINKELIMQLNLAADDPEEQAVVDRLALQLPAMLELVSSMPLVLCNPGLNISSLIVDENEQPLLVSWAKWSLEPLGVGVPIKIKQAVLQEMLDKAAEKRPEFGSIKPGAVVLTSMAAQLEKDIIGQNYKKAIQLVPGLLEKMGVEREA